MVRRSLVAPLAAAIMLLGATASVAVAAGDERRVTILDACDGPTFNAAIGAPVCDRASGVTFDRFIDQLVTFGEAPAWRFAPESFALETGGTIEAYNVGGEAHTFTEVAAFGGGCVPDLNAVLGLTPVPECADPALFGSTLVLPGEELEVEGLPSGTHLFECLIHPWMRSTVTVE
jgi:plastocyanin